MMHHVAIDEERMSQLQLQLYLGNACIADLWSRTSRHMDVSDFREDLLRQMNSDKMIKLGKKNKPIFREALSPAFALREAQEEISKGFVDMCWWFANNFKIRGMNKDDIFSECCFVLYETTFEYVRLEVKFVTLAFTCIRNHLINVSQKKETRHRGLPMVQLSDMDGDEAIDLAALAVPYAVQHPGGLFVRDARSHIDFEEEDSNIVLVRELIKDRRKLTPLQRATVTGAMKSNPGWQTVVAGRTINPSKGEPYSRAAIRVALEQLGKILIDQGFEIQDGKVA